MQYFHDKFVRTRIAYKIAIEDPLDGLPIEILVHDYTSKGLFKHLKSREGRALVCHAEMTSFFENLLKKQSEAGGECQMFCRFHDGNSKIIRTSHEKGGKKEEIKDEREQLDKACLVIGGVFTTSATHKSASAAWFLR